jgi:putative transposase
LFGEVVEGELLLNEFGKIAKNEWKNTANVWDNCIIHEFIIMPNLIHGIVEITFNKGCKDSIGKFKSPSQTIGSIVRGFKISVRKIIKDSLTIVFPIISEVIRKNRPMIDYTNSGVLPICSQISFAFKK